MNALLGIRRDDSRAVWTAFTILLTTIASHAVLETARDALFLADLPVTRLPWAYLGIATLAYVGARASKRLLPTPSPHHVLPLMLLFGAVGTLAFWWIVAAATSSSLMALYIWTGVLASIVVTQFWADLGSRMDVGQAKRAYAIVAAGGMMGATAGSLLAGAALHFEGPRVLLPVAAGLFGLAAGIAALSGATVVPAIAAPADPSAADDDVISLEIVWKDQYLKRILLLAIVGPIIAMGIDFIFKSIVSHAVPRAALGPFFARFNAIVNATALIFQLTLASRLLQHLGVVRNLCLLPGALGLVAAGVAGTATLPAALVLRGTDGVLRHSLHRAATEILFVPLSASTRSALRGLAESLGQRGGQVLGSVAILVASAFSASPRELAVGVALLCFCWLVGYVRLQQHYVERFRNHLRTLSVADATVPELDLQSLETLVATLSASNDAEVRAALDLLDVYGRLRLVSPLILYHPSSPVVIRALTLFERVQRDDIQAIRRRLLDHHDPEVRAAALRGWVGGGGEATVVRTLLRSDPSSLVRRTALVLWLGFAEMSDPELDDAVADLIGPSDHASRRAVATALSELPVRVLVPVASALLDDPTPAVRREVARALAIKPDEHRLLLLTRMVAISECRASARAGLCALGEPALEHLARVLADETTLPLLRRHLPRTISRFASARAADILVTQLAHERDGRVVYKILRGLGRMRTDDPTIPVDRPSMLRLAEDGLRRMIALLAYRVVHELRRTTEDSDLLAQLIAEKERRSLEKVFRTLQILETGEEFVTIFAGLSADLPDTRASARELIGHILDGPFRDALLALTDTLPAVERLAAANDALPVPLAATALAAWRTHANGTSAASNGEDAAAVVEAMHHDRNVVLASLARFAIPAFPPASPIEATRVAG